MRFIRSLLVIILSLAVISQKKAIKAEEKFNCESSTIKVYDEEFKCENLNNYFLNEFYSNYLSKTLLDKRGKSESNFIKQSAFSPIADWLGLYTKKFNGTNSISFGFGDQKMSNDSLKMWKAFNQEFEKITKKPFLTNNLNNGFNSSIFEESN